MGMVTLQHLATALDAVLLAISLDSKCPQIQCKMESIQVLLVSQNFSYYVVLSNHRALFTLLGLNPEL